MGDDPWAENPARTFNVLSRLAAYVHYGFRDRFADNYQLVHMERSVVERILFIKLKASRRL